MNNIAYNSISFIIEFLKIFLGGVVLLNIKIKNKKIILLGFIFSVLVLVFFSNYINLDGKSFVFSFISFFIIILSLKQKSKIIHVILVYITICLLDMIFSAIFMFTIDISAEVLLSSHFQNIIVNCISLLIIIIALFLKYKLHTKALYYLDSLKISQILIYIVGGIALGLYITSAQYFGFQDKKNSEKDLIALGLSVSSIIFIIICLSLIISNNKNKYLKKESKFNSELLKSQEKYYIMLLDKNEKTVKFRHDISNHIYCMHILLKNNEYDKLDQYFIKMGSSLSELNIEINTGNKLVDAIINDLSSKYPDTIINLTGKFPSNITISSMDLCTIFANALSNAFEASQKIDVYIRTLESTLYIKISNTIEKEVIIVDGKIKSSKNEVTHGFGIQNIESCMIKNGGSFEYKIEDNIFTAEIILSNAIIT